MGLAIRPACAEDAEALSRLMRRAIRHNNAADYPSEVIARLLARHTVEAVAAMIAKRRVFLGCEGERVVGTVALEGDVLRGLFVEVDRQGRGIAVGLVCHVEALARANGLPQLTLQSSTTAHGFYKRLGYRTQAFGFDTEGSTYRMLKGLQTIEAR